jgi:hypothetical protein
MPITATLTKEQRLALNTRWWTLWHNSHLGNAGLMIQEALVDAYSLLWAEKVESLLDRNARDTTPRERHKLVSTWTALFEVMDRDRSHSNRYRRGTVVETLLNYSAEDALGAAHGELDPPLARLLARATGNFLKACAGTVPSPFDAACYAVYACLLSKSPRPGNECLDQETLSATVDELKRDSSWFSTRPVPIDAVSVRHSLKQVAQALGEGLLTHVLNYEHVASLLKRWSW